MTRESRLDRLKSKKAMLLHSFCENKRSRQFNIASIQSRACTIETIDGGSMLGERLDKEFHPGAVE